MNLSENLVVRDFGPIVDATIEFKRITLLIGPSASGKSTLLKVVAIMRHILKMQLMRSVLRSFNVKGRKLPRLRSETYIHNAGFDTYFKPTTSLSYTLRTGDRTMHIEIDGSRRIRASGEVPEGLVYKIAFLTDLRSALAMWTEGGARSAAKGLKALDYYFSETFDLWTAALENLKADGGQLPHFPGMRVTSRKTPFHQRIVNIHSDGERASDFWLTRAASGLKTSVPLVIMLDYLAHGSIVIPGEFRKNILDQALDADLDDAQITEALARVRAFEQGKTLVSVQIEEPEISLDPATQVDLLRTMVCAAMDCAEDRMVSLAFATHSPYVLTSLNDLIMAERHPHLKADIIAPRHAVTGQVAAWQIKDGYAKNLIDAETGFVMADEMDEVSEKLGDRMCSVISDEEEA